MSFEFLSLEAIQEIAGKYGYWAVFFGIALESTGIPLPGETVTLVGGFLAGSGELNYWFVLGSAATGAVIGDNFGYWIGRVGGWSFLLRLGRLFRIEEKQLTEVRRQFGENAARAVFFGRFIALLRIFAGPLAGIAQMPYPLFIVCNLTGGVLWASVMVTLAFFCGHLVSLEQLVSWVSKFALVMLAIAVVWIGIPKWLEYRRLKHPSPSD